jgi:hypothetical protein
MKCTAEMVSGGVIYIPDLKKNVAGVEGILRFPSEI